ncbi:MAG: M28 family peptidase [Thermoguttaceae bacterium]
MGSAIETLIAPISGEKSMASKKQSSAHGFLSGRMPLVYAAIFCLCVLLAGALFYHPWAEGSPQAQVSSLQLNEIPFNGVRAYEYLKQLCAIGRRPSGSAGMAAQQKLLADHFKKLGAVVEFQLYQVPHPLNGKPVEMANILIHWHPQSKQRILLCAHYDTLPYPLMDPVNPRGVFIGANDNTGGVALLMELAHDMPKIKCKYGVDFLLLDAEEFIFSAHGRFFLGSEYFARDYVKHPPKYRYRYAVLLDMISDKNLRIPRERNSLFWKDSRALMDEIWSTAARLGVREFVDRPGDDVQDDHIMLHNIAAIPCIDIIDFEYAPWHTQGDTPDKCSPLSIAKVGWVISEWLKNAK